MPKNIKALTEDALSFPIQFYSLVPISSTLLKARARILYKGVNRNGTFIDDEVAEQLIRSLPYCPIKGVFDGEDFTAHTTDRSEGKVYGVVPETCHYGWENYLDDDGFYRNYLCADVILFTGIFKEANEILGKSLSMELYKPTLDGYFELGDDGRTVLHLTNAEFSGLQVLGDDVIPCFEGAGFYSKSNTMENLKKEIDKAWANYQQSNKPKIGGLKMNEGRITVVEGMTENSLFTVLNPAYTEEGGYTVDYSIIDAEKSIVYNHAEGKLQVVSEVANDEGVMDYSFEDYSIPEEVQQDEVVSAVENYSVEMEEGTTLTDKFNKITADYEALQTAKTDFESQISEYENKISEFEKEKVETEERYSTLEQENKKLQADYTKLDEETKAQIEELSAYKANDEKEKKVALIGTYADKLDKESIDKFVEGVDNYTLDTLDRELAYALVKSDPSLFSKEPNGIVPKDDADNTGLNAILSKYDK